MGAAELDERRRGRDDHEMGTRTADDLARDMQEWLVKVATSEEHDRLERLRKLVASVAGY